MKKIIFLMTFWVIAQTAFAQTPWGGMLTKVTTANKDSVATLKLSAIKDFVLSYATGGGTVSAISVVTANGLAGTSDGNASAPALTLTTTITGVLKGNGTAISAATVGTDYSVGTSALATGILKSTTTTGALSIAVAGDFPTLNQNTTGSAATLTTARSVYGNSFNGSADLTQIIASTFGGTGNGFTKFTGPATSEKTFTLPNASATILTDNAAVTAAQGGTGQTTYAIGDLLQASASTTLSKLAAVATGNVLISGGVTTVSSWGKVGLTTHVSGILPGANGGTNNGFFDVTGPTTSLKTFTFPNASATVLTTNAAVTVAQGGTGATTLSGVLFGNGTGAFTATALGGDVTLYGSNGSAGIFYTPAITHLDAAFGYSRSTATMNLNIPNATASLGGIVSTATQTFAGNKTWGGTHTNTGLITGNGGIVGVATSTVAAVNTNGAEDGAFRTVTAGVTLSETDLRVYVGTLSANGTMALPACNATRDGWTWKFVRSGADSNTFVIDPNASETINGNATLTVVGQYRAIDCQCINGVGWITTNL